MEHGTNVDLVTQRKGVAALQAGHETHRGGPILKLQARSDFSANAHGGAACLFDNSICYCPETSQVRELCIRAFDCTAAVTILLFAWPFMLAAALAIRLTSIGPALYRQERVGKTGKVFTLYKFRTMVNNAERHCGPVWATANDVRVIPVGKILRRTHLDELPQLFNILAGDMSLVGPRPERPVFVRRHRALQGMRLTVKPGLTGLAQVRNRYDLRPDHKVKYDCLYIQKRSVLLNAYILLQTIRVVFTKKGR